jgi:hypothetical protein
MEKAKMNRIRGSLDLYQLHMEYKEYDNALFCIEEAIQRLEVMRDEVKEKTK